MNNPRAAYMGQMVTTANPQRLLVKGWVSAEWGTTAGNRRARYYQLTREGRRQLEAELAQFQRVTGAIVRVLQAG